MLTNAKTMTNRILAPCCQLSYITINSMRLAVQYFQLHGIFLTRFYDSYVFITSVIVNESNIIENK